VPSERGYSPGQRSGIELWEKVLGPAGIHVDLVPFETPALRAILPRPGNVLPKVREMLRSFWRRYRQTADLNGYDAVFVYREAALLGPALLERWIARKGKPIIYALDDPLYVPYVSPANGYFSYLKFFGKVATICGVSRVVIVNSTQHREFAKRYNANVRVIPSLVDEQAFRFVRKAQTSEACVGWSGSASTASNLSLIAEPLRELVRRRGCEIRLIGAPRFPLEGVPYVAQEWRAATEVDDLRRLDVGLVPLPDSPWNRRKFYLKVAQYMALGIVPVATPLGSNLEVIEHGRTGFLASTGEEWLAHLETLVAEPELRAEMSSRAAELAHRRFTLAANAEALVDAFRSAVA
jgi:glycosyltransferase involved in cell wall biosynthesis